MNDNGTIIDMSATDSWIAGGAGELRIVATPLPRKAALLPNRPNPFNASTEIQFSMPLAQEVVVEIYDLKGVKIHTLFSGEAQAGLNSLVWYGVDDCGATVASGVYFVRLTMPTESLSRKITLIK